MMEVVKAASGTQMAVADAEAFVLILSPWAPHLAEELWSRMGNRESLAHVPWPTWDPEALVQDRVTLAVQVQGRMRGTVVVDPDDNEEHVVAAAQAAVADHLDRTSIIRTIVVPGRLVNFVVS